MFGDQRSIRSTQSGEQETPQGLVSSETVRLTERQTFESSSLNVEYEEAAKKDRASEYESRRQLILKFVKNCIKYLRPDFILDHLDIESFKIVLRTFFGIFVSILLIVIGPSLNYIGASVYLAAVVSCIEVSGNVSISQAFFTGVLDISVALLAYSINVVGHAIGWHIKGNQTRASVMEELVAAGICTVEDKKCLMHEIFSGRYLTTKSSVVMIIAMMCSLVLCGWLGTKSKLYMVPWTLSSLCTCITGLNMNLLPFFDPWLFGRAIFIPLGFGLSIRFVLSIIWFPFSSNFRFVTSVSDIITDITNVLETNKTNINQLLPSDSSFDQAINEWNSHSFKWIKQDLLLPTLSMFAKLELAFGIFSPRDLAELRDYTKNITDSVISDRYFYIHILEKRRLIERCDITKDFEESLKAHRYTQVGYWDNYRLEKSEDLILDGMSTESLNQIYSEVIKSYGEIPVDVAVLLRAVVKWLDCVNEARLFMWLLPNMWKKHLKKRHDAINALRKAYNSLSTAVRDHEAKVKDPNHFDPPVTDYSHRYFAFEMASFYGCCLKRLVDDVKNVADFCLNLDEEQKNPKFTFPLAYFHIVSLIMDTDFSEGDGDVDNGEVFCSTSFDPTSDVEARDPESNPSRSMWHFAGKRIKFYLGKLYGENFLYCLKRAAAVMMASLTFMSRRTAGYSHDYQIIWVPVMVAFTTTNIALDAGYNFYWRLYYTVVGCVVGIVCWYAGDGHGAGNPYGFTAALSVVMLFMSFYRHFHQLLIPTGAVILLTTTVLVTTVSWVNNTPLATSKLGSGWKSGHIRFVTVLIGLSIALVTSLLPRPKTARRQVRINMGKVLESLLETHATISKFAAQRSKTPSIHIKLHKDHVRTMIQSLEVVNLQTKNFISQIKYEPSITSVWPQHRYELLLKFIEDSVVLLKTIYQFLDAIEVPENILVALQRMGWTDIDLTSNICSIVSMSSRALAIPLPLPSMMPPSIIVMYGALQEKLVSRFQKQNEVGKTELSQSFKDLYQSPDGRHIMALSTTCSLLYIRLDGCMRIIKGLVGESFGADKYMFKFDIEAAPLLNPVLEQ